MLPPLALVDDFAARTPGGVAASDRDRVEALLKDASTLVRIEAGTTWVNDAGDLEGVPDVAVVVTIAAARRAFANPDGVVRESAGSFSQTLSNASPDVYLTVAEKVLVRRAVGRSGVWSLSVTRAESDLLDVPALYPSYVGGTGAPEEVDPFDEGWPG